MIRRLVPLKSYPRPLRLLLIAVLAMFAIQGGGTTASDVLQQAAIKPSDKADITSLETYLNSVRTLQSSFVQTASNGHVAEGTLYLSRPGKLRIDYKPPALLQIFGDNIWLTFVDRELREINQLPIGATPASLLLRDKISLSGDIQVNRITRRNGLIRLHLARSGEPEAGQLIVVLATAPLSLRGWTVIDVQGIETTVTLVAPAINGKIANRVFVFDNPDWANTTLE